MVSLVSAQSVPESKDVPVIQSQPFTSVLHEYGAERWFEFVSVAEWVTEEIVDLAHAVDNPEPQLTRFLQGAELLRELERLGVLVQDVSGASDSAATQVCARYRLVEPYRRRLLDEAVCTHGSVEAAREQLLAIGLTRVSQENVGQLAVWARQLEKWNELRRLWRQHWAWLWNAVPVDLRTQAYADLPNVALWKYPELEYASVSCGRGAGQSAAVRRRLVSDGRLIFGSWRAITEADRAVAAGTLSLGADFTAGDYAQAAETVKEIDDRIRIALRRGEQIRAMTIANYSFYASTAAFLQGRISETLSRAENAVEHARGGSYAGPIASAFLVLNYAALGDIARTNDAREVFERLRDDRLPNRDLIEVPLLLSEGVLAARTLDRGRLLGIIADVGRVIEYSELWFCYERPRTQAAILWGNPGDGLMHLDASVMAHQDYLKEDGLPAWVVARSRAELLIADGRINRALEIIGGMRGRRAAALMVVPAAQARIAAGDGGKAAIIANSGLYNEAVFPVDRFRLAVLKTAGLMYSDADDRKIAEAMQFACCITTSAFAVDAYAMLPGDLFSSYLAFHDNSCADPYCLLADPGVRARLSEIRGIPGNATLIKLTRREQVLLPYLASSATVPEIAKELIVSVNTLRKQVATLRAKLGARDRKELVRRAQELGLLSSR